MKKIYLKIKLLFIDDYYFCDEDKFKKIHRHFENLVKESKNTRLLVGAEDVLINKKKIFKDFDTNPNAINMVHSLYLHRTISRGMYKLFQEIFYTEEDTIIVSPLVLMSRKFIDSKELNDKNSDKMVILKMSISDAIMGLLDTVFKYINKENVFIKLLCKEYTKDPCGDCIAYGDFHCMENVHECEYSDKEVIKELNKEESDEFRTI